MTDDPDDDGARPRGRRPGLTADLYDLLRQFDVKLTTLVVQFQNLVSAQARGEADLTDHEARIRSLEASRTASESASAQWGRTGATLHVVLSLVVQAIGVAAMLYFKSGDRAGH